MHLPAKRTGFSLIEVIVATGIFTVAVVAILALLPSLTRQSAEDADALTAQRLPDAMRIELQRLAAGDFNALAATVPVMSAPLAGGLDFVAIRDGSHLHSVTYLPPAATTMIPEDDRYFFIEVWRFGQAPLAFDSTAAVLPLFVRVSWPYRNPGGAGPTALSDRSQFTFTVAISR